MVHGLPLLFLVLKTYVKPILIGNNIRKKLRFSEIAQWKIQSWKNIVKITELKSIKTE